MATTTPMCRHCGKYKVSRPRRLCHGCFKKRDVREQYPKDTRYCRSGTEHRNPWELRCDHCPARIMRKKAGFQGTAPWPDGWRRVKLTPGPGGESCVECPACAKAWDERWPNPNSEV